MKEILSKRGGFTLIELMIVVAIIAVMSAIASRILPIEPQDSVSSRRRIPYQTPDAGVLNPTNAIAFSLYDNVDIRPIVNLSPDAKYLVDDTRKIKAYKFTGQTAMDKGR